MTAQQVHAEQRDGFLRMTGEDELMFSNPSPFQADVSLGSAGEIRVPRCWILGLSYSMNVIRVHRRRVLFIFVAFAPLSLPCCRRTWLLSFVFSLVIPFVCNIIHSHNARRSLMLGLKYSNCYPKIKSTCLTWKDDKGGIKGSWVAAAVQNLTHAIVVGWEPSSWSSRFV